jgi:hypothetical protein
MAKEIEFTIFEGDVEVDMKGWNGKGCDAIAKGFAEVLGDSSAVVKHKKEYNAPGLTKAKLEQKQ